MLMSSTQTILVGTGHYHEVLNVTRHGPLTILVSFRRSRSSQGVTPDVNSWGANTVYVWNSSYINQTTQTASQHNSQAVVLTIGPSSPGSSDFKMYNIDVANRAVSAFERC